VFATGGSDGCRGRCGDHHLGLIEVALDHRTQDYSDSVWQYFGTLPYCERLFQRHMAWRIFDLGRLLSGGIADPERQPGVLDLCWKDSGFRSLALYDIPHVALSNNITYQHTDQFALWWGYTPESI
jgi:hypothetical protein